MSDKEQDRDVLLWNFERVDYLLRLAEHGLTEATELDYRKIAVVPQVVPKKLTKEQRQQQIDHLNEQKGFLMEKLKIPKIKT